MASIRPRPVAKLAVSRRFAIDCNRSQRNDRTLGMVLTKLAA